MDCNRQYQYTVEIEKTSFQLVLLFRGDELPRQHGAQLLRGFFLEGGRWEAKPRPLLDAERRREVSLHSRGESTQDDVSARVADRQRNFSTLNADEKSVFTRAVNRHKATSLLAWQIDKETSQR
jgi:hypothetical protein